MRYMPDSAVLGTVGHIKRRNAKARRRNARRNAQIAKMRFTGKDYAWAVAMMLGFILVVNLFV